MEDRPSLREFTCVVWIGDEPGIRSTIYAGSGSEVREQLIAEHGEGHTISITDVEAARKPR